METTTDTILECVYIYDSGHAWFMISLEHLGLSLIKSKISRCSYKSKSHAYLEEDCDAPKFFEAMKLLNFDIKIREKHIDDFDIIIRRQRLTSF